MLLIYLPCIRHTLCISSKWLKRVLWLQKLDTEIFLCIPRYWISMATAWISSRRSPVCVHYGDWPSASTSSLAWMTSRIWWYCAKTLKLGLYCYLGRSPNLTLSIIYLLSLLRSQKESEVHILSHTVTVTYSETVFKMLFLFFAHKQTGNISRNRQWNYCLYVIDTLHFMLCILVSQKSIGHQYLLNVTNDSSRNRQKRKYKFVYIQNLLCLRLLCVLKSGILKPVLAYSS